MMIELYGMGSHNVYKVAIMLEECSLPYQLVRVDVFKGEQFDPEFMKIGPNSKVPVIVDPDGPAGRPLSVFESGAILLYLAEKSGVLWPEDSEFRSRVLQWLFLQVGTVGPMFGQFNHFGRYAPPGLNDYAFARYRTEVFRILSVLNRRLEETPYLAGDDYSLADIATYPRLKLLHADLIELDPHKHGAIRHWIDEISERPAVIRAMATLREPLESDGASMSAASPDALDRLFGRGQHAE